MCHIQYAIAYLIGTVLVFTADYDVYFNWHYYYYYHLHLPRLYLLHTNRSSFFFGRNANGATLIKPSRTKCYILNCGK